MSTQNPTPALHEALGYEDADLAYERRYLGRREAHRPTRPLADPTACQAMRGGPVEGAHLPQAPRYVWKGGSK